MIDIHAHVLPAVDDGPASLREAIALCERVISSGCTELIATPHQNRDRWPNLDPEALRRQLMRLQAAVGPRLKLHLGAEITVSSSFVERLEQDLEHRYLTLAGSRYVLLELSTSGLGPDPNLLLHELQVLGHTPVIAHPERLPWLYDFDTVFDLVDRGAHLQITSSALSGRRGRRERGFCRKLLDRDLVHFIASDCHDLDVRRPDLDEARKIVQARWGAHRARRLFFENPHSILEHRELETAA